MSNDKQIDNIGDYVISKVNEELLQTVEHCFEKIQNLMNDQYYFSNQDTNLDLFIEEILIVLDYLRYEKPDFAVSHIFVGGECDTNQTTYEKKSNHLEIGVFAKSKKVGNILLTLLRLITDMNLWPLLSIWDDNETPSLTLDECTNWWSNYEQFVYVHAPNEIISTKLYKYDRKLGRTIEFQVTKLRSQMDLWDLERFVVHFKNNFKNDFLLWLSRYPKHLMPFRNVI